MNITFDSFPRQGSRAASDLASSFAAAVRRSALGVWDTLQAHGEARARPRLLEIAERMTITDPELAARIRQAASNLR